MRLLVGFWTLLVLSAFGCKKTDTADTTVATPPQRPIPELRQVLIMSVDGMRPDVMLRCKVPHIRPLLDRGSYTFYANTTDMAVTLPSHVSMLTGAVPDKHGITWNDHTEGAYSQVPTLFEMAKKAGYTTAMVTGKSKFICFDKPGTLDWREFLDEDTMRDPDTADHAVKMIHEHKPQVMFVHFGDNDTIGHAEGWGTPQQQKAIEIADASIGKVLKAYDEEGLTSSTAIFITADHGGAGLQHGPDDVRSRLIPWIVAGPGLRQNYDLTRVPNLTVNTMDTFATACFFLGITPQAGLDCKPIREVVAQGELLHSK